MAQPSTLPPLMRGEWVPMDWGTVLAWSSEEGRFEWVDGHGIAHLPDSTAHGRTVVFLVGFLGLYLRVFDLGHELFFGLLLRLPTRPSARMPDLFVVGPEDRERVRYHWADGPVRLVVEILSEESVGRDLGEKRAEYERAGIPEYLVLGARPDGDGFAYLRLDGEGRYRPVEPDGRGRYHSAALPGLWLDPAWFRRDPRPDPDELLLQIAPDAFEAYVMAIIRAHREAPEMP